MQKNKITYERLARELELAIWMIPGIAERLESRDRDRIHEAILETVKTLLENSDVVSD